MLRLKRLHLRRDLLLLRQRRVVRERGYLLRNDANKGLYRLLGVDRPLDALYWLLS